MPILIQRWTARLRRCGRASLATLIFCASLPAAAPRAASSEYQLKAVFLFNFAQFVEWPQNAFPDDSAPFVIGVLGEDPFGAYLDELVRGEKIGPHPLRIRRFADATQVADCHILFISDSESDRLDRDLKELAGKRVLTVSDIGRFARIGGMVRFVVEDGRIRLRINIAAARSAHLAISSKILRVATIVSAGND